MKKGLNLTAVVSLAWIVLAGSGCEPASPVAGPQRQIDFNAVLREAQQGDSKAQQQLGEAYASGQGAPADYSEAAKWLSKSAAQTNAVALYLLGQLHEAGQGVPQNYTEAARCYSRAAELGHAPAQYSLAVLYAFGRGFPVNDKEAARWYEKAAEQGDALAQFNIGQRYQAGRGVTRDLLEAYKWLSLAAQEIPDSAAARDELKSQLTSAQLHEAKNRVSKFQPRKSP